MISQHKLSSMKGLSQLHTPCGCNNDITFLRDDREENTTKNSRFNSIKSLVAGHLKCMRVFIAAPKQEFIMTNEFICPFSVTSPWVCVEVCVRVSVCMQMSNGGDYWGSEIRESIWLSWDDRRPLPLPASHQGDTHTHTHTHTHLWSK